MKNISPRIEHVKPSAKSRSGYCLICGNHGQLSEDHVPPRSCIHTTKAEQRLLTEVLGLNNNLKPAVKAKRGSTFITICATCNSLHIGSCDEEISRTHKILHTKIQAYFSTPYSIPAAGTVSVELNTTRYCRAMIGHILSATTSRECLQKPFESDYFDPLKKFVLGDDNAIRESHDIYYWFYPYAMHISAKHFAFRNKGHITSLSALHFNPIAFLVTPKEKGIYPAHACKLSLDDKYLFLNLSLHNLAVSQFPLCGLTGDQMMALYDGAATISYPVGN